MGDRTVKVFKSYDNRIEFGKSPLSVGWQCWAVPKQEFKALAKLKDNRFAFDRLHMQHKTQTA